MGSAKHSAWRHHTPRWLAVTASVLLLTFLLLILHASSTISGIVYIVLIVWLASQVGTPLSIFAAFLSAILFDFYFLEPRYSLAIANFQDWLAMSAFLVSCVVVARVAERARRQTRQAEQRRADMERLYALSQEMMLHEDPVGLIRDIPRLVERVFSLDAVLLYVLEPKLREPDQLYSSVPGTVSLELHTTLRNLTSTPEASTGLPDGFFAVPLIFGMKNVGTLAWRPATLSHEVATSVSAQVALALTRSLAIEAAARMEAARASDRLRTALIDSLTHELRTPLTAIRAAATTLLDGRGLDSEIRTDLASVIDEESSRLDHLIGQAIEMAQIDAKSIRVRPVPAHTSTVLHQAVEECRHQLASHIVSIHIDGPDAPVAFDPHLITRVLRHLLENAARYTPPGTHITLRSRHLTNKIEFSVEDSGPGIDAYDLPMIFEKFYRGKRTNSTAKGSGMGLAIARAIMTAQGGTITAQSVSGQGTTFRLQIPAEDKASVSAERMNDLP